MRTRTRAKTGATAFVRSLPITMSVTDVLERARRAGVKCAAHNVHQARFQMRREEVKGKRAAASASAPSSGCARCDALAPQLCADHVQQRQQQQQRQRRPARLNVVNLPRIVDTKAVHAFELLAYRLGQERALAIVERMGERAIQRVV